MRIHTEILMDGSGFQGMAIGIKFNTGAINTKPHYGVISNM